MQMTSYSWATNVSGDWNSGTLWSTGTVPNSGTADVTIDAATTIAPYTVTIGAGESFTVDSLTINNTDPDDIGASTTGIAAELTIDGTLTFAAGSAGVLGNSAGGGSLQTLIGTDFGDNAEIINAGTVDGFIQVFGSLLFTGTNGLYITNDLQSQGTVTVDTKSIAEMTGNTLFDGIFQAVGPNAVVNLGGTLEGLIVNIATIEGPANGPNDASPAGWTELTLNGPDSAINEWNGTAYVSVETTLTNIESGGTVDVLTGRDYTTSNTLTISDVGSSAAPGMLNLQAGTVTAAAIDINGGIVQGSATIVGGVVNNGTMIAEGGVAAGTLDLTGNLTGTGTVEFDFDDQQGSVDAIGSTLAVNSVSAGQTIVMNGDDTLVLNSVANFAGTIEASVGDQIVLNGIAATGAFLDAGSLVVMNNSATVASLALAGNYTGEHAALSGTTVTIASGTVLPTITGTAAGQAVNDTGTIAPFARVTIGDPNVSQTETVTVTLSAAVNGVLTNLGGGSYNAATGVYTDTGSAGAVTTALDGLVFVPTAHEVAPGGTTTTGFTIGDTDTAGDSATDNTTSVIATAVTVLPTISGTVAGQMAVDTGTIAPFSRVTIGDANLGQAETVTVTLSAAVNGRLSNLGGGSYDAATGVYTDTGSAGAVTTALDGLVFVPTAGQTLLGQTVTTTFTIADTDTASQSATESTASVVATGVAGDPNADILFQNDDGQMAMWESDGASIITSALVGPDPGSAWYAMATGAFYPGDTSDIVFQNTDGSVALWQVQGSTLDSAALLPDPGSAWHIAGTGDFYGDGNTDLLFQNIDGSIAIWDMNGTTTVQSGLTPDPGPTWHIEGTGNFFGTGNNGIVLQNDDGSVALWKMNGTNIAQSSVIANPGVEWRVAGTGDFYGDGNTDILFQNANGSIAIWDMQGTTVVQAGYAPDPGPTWHVEGTGDFNNDGKTDIVLQNDSGTVAVWEMSGTTITSASLIANPPSAWHLLGSDENMRFISSGAANEVLTATPTTPEEFLFNNPAAGAHTISGFSTVQDMIELSGAQFADFAAVQAATTATAAGAVINLGNSTSLLLQGVDASTLHARDFMLT
jgi:hypothetical protein